MYVHIFVPVVFGIWAAIATVLAREFLMASRNQNRWLNNTDRNLDCANGKLRECQRKILASEETVNSLRRDVGQLAALAIRHGATTRQVADATSECTERGDA